MFSSRFSVAKGGFNRTYVPVIFFRDLGAVFDIAILVIERRHPVCGVAFSVYGWGTRHGAARRGTARINRWCGVVSERTSKLKRQWDCGFGLLAQVMVVCTGRRGCAGVRVCRGAR